MDQINFSNRSFIILLVGLFAAFGIACNAKEKKPEAPKIVFNTVEEVKDFVRQNLDKPIPDDYQIPSYISSGLPLEQVYDTLANKYPDFYGKEGQTYLEAIQQNPARYLEMSLESKSIRRYYDPQSKY